MARTLARDDRRRLVVAEDHEDEVVVVGALDEGDQRVEAVGDRVGIRLLDPRGVGPDRVGRGGLVEDRQWYADPSPSAAGSSRRGSGAQGVWLEMVDLGHQRGRGAALSSRCARWPA